MSSRAQGTREDGSFTANSMTPTRWLARIVCATLSQSRRGAMQRSLRHRESVTSEQSRAQRARRYRVTAAVLVLLVFSGLALAATAWARNPLAPAQRWGEWRVRAAGGRLLGRDQVVLQTRLFDCGPAALVNLFVVLHRKAPSVHLIARLAETTPAGTSLIALADASAHLALPLALRWQKADEPLPPPPFIAWVDRGHFVTVVARDDHDVLLVLDPTLGRYLLPESAFRARWSGAAALPERISPP
jgi:hypothetical protein